ncbi:hypothetical protein ACFFMN_25365 [Planobispora siamensis]|uniref:Uncharacterized protein n=1 Tax=Planobispora siamensis TaxID=936338 RepID=A0A8J3WNR7_9ACTN|nr:hypothetical protein [Planobispora siamensis]GIH94171.1 hypothetical protein Psi01_48010 [Planobispora siamensis]
MCTSLRDTPQDHTDYVLHVPRGLDVTVHSRNGDITLRGLRGRVDAHASNGTVHRDPSAQTQIQTPLPTSTSTPTPAQTPPPTPAQTQTPPPASAPVPASSGSGTL